MWAAPGWLIFGQSQCGTSRDNRNEQLQEVTNFIRGRFGAENAPTGPRTVTGPSPPPFFFPCSCFLLPFFLLHLSFPFPLRPFSCSSLQLLSRGGVRIGHRTHILALNLTTKITTVTSVRRRDETKRLNVYARLDFLNSRKQLSCAFN